MDETLFPGLTGLDVMSDLSAFSSDYHTARRRFRHAALAAQATLASHEVAARGPDGDALAIDVAFLGHPRPGRVVMVSSGVHGVEGPFGSAVQLAWLRSSLRSHLPGDTAVVLVHAVNPYGFAWRRRTDERNIDLNRNFVPDDQRAALTNPRYADLDRLLNPASPPRRLDLFALRAVAHIARTGLPALKEAVASGQYRFPRGLFYGGDRAAEVAELVGRHARNWGLGAGTVLHLDLHTGLGRYGGFKILVASPPGSPTWRAFGDAIGDDLLESVRQGSLLDQGARPGPGRGSTAYDATGVIGDGVRSALGAEQAYHFAVAEFGTYNPIRVLAALRAENRAHHYVPRDHPEYERAKRALCECFCPVRESWRRRALASGVRMVQSLVAAAAEPVAPSS